MEISKVLRKRHGQICYALLRSSKLMNVKEGVIKHGEFEILVFFMNREYIEVHVHHKEDLILTVKDKGNIRKIVKCVKTVIA